MRRLIAARASLAAAPLVAVTSLQSRVLARAAGEDAEAGMSTAEYAVGTVAACGFSGVLYKIITSDLVTDLLKGLIGRALRLSF